MNTTNTPSPNKINKEKGEGKGKNKYEWSNRNWKATIITAPICMDNIIHMIYPMITIIIHTAITVYLFLINIIIIILIFFHYYY